MGKKKTKARPQQSYQQTVAELTLARFKPYIQKELQGAAQAIVNQTTQQMQALFERLVCLEELLLEEIDGLTKDDLAMRVALIQDKKYGFEPQEVVEEGDRVRIDIQTKTNEDEDYTGSSKMILDKAGSGQTLGSEIEPEIIGMKSGEVKEIKFGEDKKLTARITVSMVSRLPKKEEPKEVAETPKEEVDASPNA
jgi:hypothetical protein